MDGAAIPPPCGKLPGQSIGACSSERGYDNCYIKQKTVRDLLEQASLHHQQGHYDAALQDCDAIFKLDDRCDYAYAQAIETLSAASRYGEAAEYAIRWSRIKLQARQEFEQSSDISKTSEDGAATEVTDRSLLRNQDSDKRSDGQLGQKLPNDGFSAAVQEAVAFPSRESPVTVDAAASVSNSEQMTKITPSGWRCSFCSKTLASPSAIRIHLRCPEHLAKVTSDSEQHWKYREPPHGFIEDEYLLCEKYCTSGPSSCRYGESCIQAHSQAELDEWRKRFAFRQKKALDAEQEATALLRSIGPPSLSECIKEYLLSPRSGSDSDQSSVLVQALDGVQIKCSSDLNVSATCKKFEHIWEFTITSALTLQEITFVEEAEDVASSPFYFAQVRSNLPEQNHLSIMAANEKCREWTNETLRTVSGSRANGRCIYTVKIGFRTSVFGTFDKLVAFAFGKTGSLKPPFVTRLLRVEVKPVDLELETESLRISESCRWDSSSSGVALLPFVPRPTQLNEFEEQLITSYKCPSPKTFRLSAELVSKGLSRHNYKACLHELLYAEEMAQCSTISKYNVEAVLHISNVVGSAEEGVSGYKYSAEGQLFARVDLNSVINEDSREGRLLLQNVTTVYLQPRAKNSSPLDHQQAYEAVIEEKGASWITFRLSRTTVQQCQLLHGMTCSFLMQFIPSRLTVCELHWAVDAVRCLDALFPNIDQLSPLPWRPSLCQLRGLMYKDRALNVKQKEAVARITTSRNVLLPPILLLGPFGTGKTFTLAEAALKLVIEEPDARVLLCTHSNSAADLYIRDHFDRSIRPLAEAARKKPHELLVRIYYRSRRVNTVEVCVQNYSLQNHLAGNFDAFRDPTLEDLQSARIVVTTLMASRCLSTMRLPEGFFTHILIDEAAQAMEAEALVPLALATAQTRIALAGDHMQMSPEVFSDLARSHCLHVSLIERLHDMYPDTAPTKIMLCENYRSHPVIVRFASATFYDRNLVASGKQLDHPWLYPLCFFTARGDDTPLGVGGVSYYNNAEVFETVDRVVEIWRSWPTERWGELSDTSIGVVTPYADQVIRIRSELRKRHLQKVSVERVFNVQGKQFRVVIISTVRTNRTCTASDAGDTGISYGFLTDAKLLNTAMTRAQSLVAVVGDPLSLSSVGQCRKIWESYIETCHTNGSLYGITWNEVRAHLDGINIKKTFTLNPLAAPFVPRYVFYAFPCVNCGHQNEVLATSAVTEIPGHVPSVPCLIHLRPRPTPSLLPVPVPDSLSTWSQLNGHGGRILPSSVDPSASVRRPEPAPVTGGGQVLIPAPAFRCRSATDGLPLPVASPSVAVDKHPSTSCSNFSLAGSSQPLNQLSVGSAPETNARSPALSKSATVVNFPLSVLNIPCPISGPVRPPLNTVWGMRPAYAGGLHPPQLYYQAGLPTTYCNVSIRQPQQQQQQQLQQQHHPQHQQQQQHQMLSQQQLRPQYHMPPEQQKQQQLLQPQHSQQLHQQPKPQQLQQVRQHPQLLQPLSESQLLLQSPLLPAQWHQQAPAQWHQQAPAQWHQQPNLRPQPLIRQQLPWEPWQQLGHLLPQQQSQLPNLQPQPQSEPHCSNAVNLSNSQTTSTTSSSAETAHLQQQQQQQQQQQPQRQNNNNTNSNC